MLVANGIDPPALPIPQIACSLYLVASFPDQLSLLRVHRVADGFCRVLAEIEDSVIRMSDICKIVKLKVTYLILFELFSRFSLQFSQIDLLYSSLLVFLFPNELIGQFSITEWIIDV